MGKKITVSLSIILICTFTFINGYTYVYPSYADSNTDTWTSVTTNQELAEAFRYYCKSRNLAIEGSVLDALTTFTTNNFNTICNTLGIDVTALQAHLKRSTDSNNRVQFLFDQFGVTAYNRIFAEFLQNNNLSVGDSANQQDDTIYEGYFYNDPSGNACFCYVVTDTGPKENQTLGNDLKKLGTPYVYDGNYLYSYMQRNSLSTYNFPLSINGNTLTNFVYSSFNIPDAGYNYVSPFESSPPIGIENFNSLNFKRVNVSTGQVSRLGNIAIFYSLADSKLYYGYYSKLLTRDTTNHNWYIRTQLPINTTDNNFSNQYIFLTTNNNVINNNTYNDNRQTVINNEGDVYNYNYDDDDPPVNQPPGTVTPPSNSGGDDGDISFPDFNFQLPEINWSLGDLSEKFPFSIPFDLIAFFTVLNAEPQAPSIDANIPLGSWYTWHFQADFSQFNNWATIIRNVEFIAFCIGLIYLTIRLVKG